MIPQRTMASKGDFDADGKQLRVVKLRTAVARVLKPLSDADKQRLQDIVRKNMALNVRAGRKE